MLCIALVFFFEKGIYGLDLDICVRESVLGKNWSLVHFIFFLNVLGKSENDEL